MKKYLLSTVLILAGLGLFSQPCIENPSSLNFNGTSSQVRINGLNGLEIGQAITIEAWIYATQWAPYYTQGTIVCKHEWNTGSWGYVLRAGANGVLCFNFAGLANGVTPVGWVETITPDGLMTLNTWYHVAATFDGSTIVLYINGTQFAENSFYGSIDPSYNLPVRIGQLADSTHGLSRYWHGLIDEVRIWNRALSSGEIQANMFDHIDPAQQTGLVGYWRFNENGGYLVNDLSGQNNNGTNMGATWDPLVPWNHFPPPVPTITYVAGNLHSSAPAGNQWYYEGTLIPGATQQYYTPTQYGNYNVVVMENGCSSSSAQFYYNTTGLNLLQGNASFTVSPVPASGDLRILVSGPDAFNEIRITDVFGNIILRPVPLTAKESVVSLSAVPPGVYLLRLSGPGAVSCRKIVVQ